MIELRKNGLLDHEIAEALGVSKSRVANGFSRMRRAGHEVPPSAAPQGRPPILNSRGGSDIKTDAATLAFSRGCSSVGLSVCGISVCGPAVAGLTRAELEQRAEKYRGLALEIACGDLVGIIDEETLRQAWAGLARLCRACELRGGES